MDSNCFHDKENYANLITIFISHLKKEFHSIKLWNCLRFKMENWTTGNVVVLCYDGLRRWEMVNSYKIMNFEQTIIFLIICRFNLQYCRWQNLPRTMFRIEYILRLLQWGIRRNLKPKTIEEKKWIKKKKTCTFFRIFFFRRNLPYDE